LANKSRKLTPGELREAKSVFGLSINYDKVIVHEATAYFFQPNGTAITPNGEIYFPPADYKYSFATNRSDAAWLIHELTHVWQHQRGMWVRLRGMANRNYDYGDLSKSKLAFLSQGVEVQASIVGDYYRIKYGLKPVHGTGALSDYERTIPFISSRRA
jgi:hypothetical protein